MIHGCPNCAPGLPCPPCSGLPAAQGPREEATKNAEIEQAIYDLAWAQGECCESENAPLWKSLQLGIDALRASIVRAEQVPPPTTETLPCACPLCRPEQWVISELTRETRVVRELHRLNHPLGGTVVVSEVEEVPSVPPVSPEQTRKEDDACAGLIHQVAGPLAETEPRPTADEILRALGEDYR